MESGHGGPSWHPEVVVPTAAFVLCGVAVVLVLFMRTPNKNERDTSSVDRRTPVGATKPTSETPAAPPVAIGIATEPLREAPTPRQESVAPLDSRPSTGVGATEPPVEAIVAETDSSVVIVSHSFGTGSGFCVDTQLGYIATNFHVVAWANGSNDIKVIRGTGFFAGVPVQGEVVYCDERYDLAILRAPVAAIMSPLKLASGEPRKGQDVLVIGSPGTGNGRVLPNSVTRGIISNITRLDDGATYYQLDAAVNPGNSGGPVLDRMGRVIGVVTLKLPDHEGVAFAVPASALAEAIESAKRERDPNRAGRVLLRRQLAVGVDALVLAEYALIQCFADLEARWREASILQGDITGVVKETLNRHRDTVAGNCSHVDRMSKFCERWQKNQALPGNLLSSLYAYMSSIKEFCSFSEGPSGSYLDFEKTWPSRMDKMGQRRETLLPLVKGRLREMGTQP